MTDDRYIAPFAHLLTDRDREIIAAWRALTPEQKKAKREQVALDRVAASMAMEGEAVSDEFVARHDGGGR